MQIELWITLLIGIFATGLITWYGTKRTIENVSRVVTEVIAKNIGEAIKAIHEDIKASQEKIEREIKKQN